MKKISIMIISIALVLQFFISCTSEDMSTVETETVDFNQIYIIESSSYVGAFVNNETSFSILIYMPRLKQMSDSSYSAIIKSFMNEYEYSILSDQNSSSLQLENASLFVQAEKGDFFTLSFSIPNPKQGVYIYYELEAKNRFSNLIVKHAIGEWYFDVRTEPSNQYIELTAGTGLSGSALDFFAASLTNIANNNVEVVGADIVLNNTDIQSKVVVFDSFDDMMSNSSQIVSKDCIIINPNQNKTFKFDYSESENIDKPVFIKPFIEYKINGETVVYLPLNGAQFIPLPDEDELLKLAMGG